MSAVLIAGGSGLIGSDLIRFLAKSGYTCRILTRGSTNESAYRYHWNPDLGTIDMKAFEGTKMVINLSGANILKGRWTKKRKKILRDSRIKSTAFLVQTIISNQVELDHFISASAMGYFGDSGNTILTETSPHGTDFMATLCRDWEAAAKQIEGHTKLSILRLGLYISDTGGFAQMVGNLAKYYLATSFGNGKQYVNYTHRDELGLVVLNLASGNYDAGTYNMVGREAVTLNEMIRGIAQSQGRKVILPNVPAFAIRLALGEAASTLLNSYRIESPKLKAKNFYEYDNLKDALKAL